MGAFQCEKCAQLNEKIVHCKALSTHTTHQLALDGIAILIGQYEAQKRELHPNQGPPTVDLRRERNDRRASIPDRYCWLFVFSTLLISMLLLTP
ncbi:hypothetical protein ACM42_06695 [Bradyrhizobium sp. CCBAU 25338]|nr:hypothetical protein [Bradyrhizobium sp. CCBAU 25338]